MKFNGLKRLAIPILVMASIQCFGMVALAATSKTSIRDVDLTVTSNIQADDDKANSKDYVTVDTDTNGVEISSIEVTNGKSGTWSATEKPVIKITLKTESSKYIFDKKFDKDCVDIEGMDIDKYTVKRTSNSRVYVTITSVKLSDTNTANTSGDYKLEIESANLDDTSGEASWEEAEDAKKYEVKLYRTNSSKDDSLVDSVSTNKDYHSFASKITSNGTYYVKVRAIYNNSHKGPYVKSNEVEISSDTVKDIKESLEEEKEETEPTTSNSNSQFVGPTVGNETDTNNTNNTPSPDKYTGDVYKSYGVNVISGTWNSYVDANGDTKWTFTDGVKAYANEWAYIKNPYAKPELGQESDDWFRFDENGNMITGWWFDEQGKGFYLNPISDNTRGRMVTGYLDINGFKYYFEEESNGNRGVMYVNTEKDGHYFGADGRALN